MPYITCPDGKTYSRYDDSPYVEWCKCEEKREKYKAEVACQKDPACLKEREDTQAGLLFAMIGCLILIFVLAFNLDLN